MGASKEEIRKAYEAGEGTFKKLSEKYEVSESTIKSWAKRDKDNEQPWTKNNSKKVATKSKKVATKKKVEQEKVEEEVKAVMKNTELTEKQKLFCVYYAKYFNATKAYQKAYQSSYNVANTEGWKLLVNPRVEAEIKRIKANKFKGAMLEAGDLLQKYIDIAFSDLTDFVEFGQNEVTATDELGVETTYIRNHVYFKNDYEVDGTLITEVKQGKDGVSVKLIDKKFALDFLAKYSGLLDVETRQKLDIEREKLELEKAKNNSDNNNKDREGIDDFIKATTMSEEEIKDLFKDDENEQE